MPLSILDEQRQEQQHVESLPFKSTLAVQSVPRPQEAARGWPGLSLSQLSSQSACGLGRQNETFDRIGIPGDSFGRVPAQQVPDCRSGQCQGPPGLKREGVRVSMSPRGPAPHSAPPRPSQSPPREAVSSSPSQRSLTYQDGSNPRPPHDPGGSLAGDGGGGRGGGRGGRGQRRGSRTSGVHNMLNPPGPRGHPQASSPPLQQVIGEASPGPRMGPLQYGGNNSPSRASGYQGQGVATPQPVNTTMSSTQASSAGPHAPSSPLAPPQPYPVTANRRILTPKSPRAASLSRAGQRLSSLPPHPGRALGQPPTATPHDASPLGAPPTLGPTPPFPGPIQLQAPAPVPPPTRPPPGISRSLSQPMMSVLTQGAPFATGMAQDRLWGSGIVGPLPPGTAGTRNLQLGEGQQHILAIQPTHGEEMYIPVDYHQASKQADEKRQRNAGASARFRQRKKEREREQQQGIQKLEAANRELEKRVEELEKGYMELEAERDYYRGERNRLRDLVARTPAISEWADRGPPSPTPSRPGVAYATEASPSLAPVPAPPLPHPYSQPRTHTPGPPLSHALAHPHPSPSSYGDPSMLERPARRRRTDSEPSLGTPSYRPNTPASLPPIPGPTTQAYAIPPSPRLMGSPGTARLPPIRFDQPPTSDTPPPIQSGQPPPPPIQPGQSSAYPSYTKGPYETGWATAPGRSGDGPSR